jgi:hypothetical protein
VEKENHHEKKGFGNHRIVSAVKRVQFVRSRVSLSSESLLVKYCCSKCVETNKINEVIIFPSNIKILLGDFIAKVVTGN